MENTDINPRLQQVKTHWELKNPYESLIASWRQYESIFQITPSYLPADLEASDDSTQEEVPVVAVLSFMNIFVGKKFNQILICYSVLRKMAYQFLNQI